MENRNIYRFIQLKDGTAIALLGTAHVSSESVADVTLSVEQFRPDSICVEIDEGRLASLNDAESWQKLDIGKILKQGKGFLLLANLALGGYQRKISANTGSSAGAEMKVACDIAKENNFYLSLCDRPIAITLQRAWNKSSFLSKNRLLASLIAGTFSNEVVTAEEIEQLKEGDNLSQMMADLAKEAPIIKEVLLDERDQYLAKKIYMSKGSRRLAVLGSGHLEGVELMLKKIDDGFILNEDDLCIIPPKGMWSKMWPWVIPLVVILLVTYSFLHIGFDKGVTSFWQWFIINGSLATIGAVIALAHPLTMVVSFVSAPFTSFIPTISVGMIAGLFQGLIRKPTVRDFEQLSIDSISVKGFYHNRITHLLLVFFLTSLGSAIGTWVGLGKLIQDVTTG